MLDTLPALSPQGSGWPVVGHDRAIAMLRNALRSGNLPHAYLFTGPPASGKRTLALTFVMALNCEVAPPPGQEWPDVPCGLCSACGKIRRGSHPDVVEVNLETQAQALGEAGRGKSGPAKELKIDAIREMQAGAGLSPHSARWKVYIIGDAERLSEEASNCLLKTLEEPPGHSILMLLAPDDISVLPTIASRCFQVPLRTVARDEVAAALVSGWQAPHDQAATAAALSGGRVGAAVSLLSDRDAPARRRRALAQLSDLSGAAIVDRVSVAADLAKMFTEARAELYEMLDTWEGWWRDVMLFAAGSPEAATNVDQETALASQARKHGAVRAAAAIELIHLTRRQLQENANPRLVLEALTLGVP